MSGKSIKRTILVLALIAGALLLEPIAAQAAYGIESFDVQQASTAPASGDEADLAASGGAYHQAGGHPYSIVTHIEWNNHPENQTGLPLPDGDIKDTYVELPAGLVGNPSAFPRCTPIELVGNFLEKGPLGFHSECPTDSQVGLVHLYFSGREAQAGILPLFNMTAPTGAAARFGFDVAGTLIYFDGSTSAANGYRITVGTHDAQQALRIYRVDVAFWGVPADPRHNRERCNAGGAMLEGTVSLATCRAPGTAAEGQGPHTAGMQPVPLLTLPTSCPSEGVGEEWLIRTNSWQEPGVIAEAAVHSHLGPFAPDAGAPGLQQGTTGCGVVPFNPDFSVAPTQQSASSPTGLNVHLSFPQDGLLNPAGIAQSHLKKAVVTFPEGVTVNPSQGEGLGVCTPGQFKAASVDSFGCPSTAKIGTVAVRTPLLEETLPGNVYIAKPYENPFDSLLAIYVVLREPQRGISIGLAAKVEPNPRTGQLTTTFEDLPQLPIESFDLSLREGARAPFVTPQACGTYTTEAEFYPWARPEEAVPSNSSFEVTSGVAGGPCPSGGGGIPFNPGIEAGLLDNNAGAFSPFYLRLSRTDADQEISGFSTNLPPGLTADLTGVPFCPEASIEAARQKTGVQEEAFPSCPAASQIGRTLVGTGVAAVLAYVPGRLYLAGPFHGAPFSLVSVTSAVVGPFDLGTVVLRFGLNVDPLTAQVNVSPTSSEPIPTIIRGIVTHVRNIRVYIDRPNFTVNPTSCNPMAIGSTLSSALGRSATVSSPFQDANCANLAFKPAFKASTSGKTSRQNGASLTVKLTYPTGSFGKDANIKSVKVDLPKQLPSRLTTLQKACTDATFNTNPAACPAASRVGQAKAITPILPVPLEGPAYFVSHGGAKFPELIVVLQGYGVAVDLHGETFISKTGITSSTFKTVPDQPVTSFELTFPQGANSALAANGNLCNEPLSMPTLFTAQNGITIKQSTAIEVTGCPYALRIAHRAVRKRTLTLNVSVPQAGRLAASGNGVSEAAKTVNGRSTLTLTLKESHAGKQRTNILLRFTPAKGKQRKILRKSITVTFV
jgi:hypothetical protein